MLENRLLVMGRETKGSLSSSAQQAEGEKAPQQGGAMTAPMFLAGLLVGSVLMYFYMSNHSLAMKSFAQAHESLKMDLLKAHESLKMDLLKAQEILFMQTHLHEIQTTQQKGGFEETVMRDAPPSGTGLSGGIMPGELSSTIVINKLEYTFRYGPNKQAIDLATEFCRKQGAALGFTEETFGDCVEPVQSALAVKMTRQHQEQSSEPAVMLQEGVPSQTQSQVQAELEAQAQAQTMDAQDAPDAAGGIRRLKLVVSDVPYVFEYHVDMTPEYAGPRLASEFCYSEKGQRLIAPLSEENQRLSGEEKEALVRETLAELCVKPLTAELIATISRSLAPST